jgi:hypothetical protein
MIPLSTEKKFVAPASQAEAALGLMAHFCVPDPEHPVGSIASVYYDTPRLAAYAEKEDGDHLKKKVRVRWYAEDKGSEKDRTHTAFLECKHRVGSARFKLRTAFAADYDLLDRAPLSAAFFLDLLKNGADILDDSLPVELLPIICIRYTRRRYICPRTFTRVAIDTDVRAERINRDVLPGVPVPRLDVTICEFKNKGHGELPWAHALTTCGFRLMSFSKFGQCIGRALNGGI